MFKIGDYVRLQYKQNPISFDTRVKDVSKKWVKFEMIGFKAKWVKKSELKKNYNILKL